MNYTVSEIISLCGEMSEYDESELTKLAEKTLLRDAVRGAARASIAGPSGWKRRNSKYVPNKRFLTNTIKGAISSNKRMDEKRICQSVSKRLHYDKILKGDFFYKRRYLTAYSNGHKSCNDSSPSKYFMSSNVDDTYSRVPAVIKDSMSHRKYDSKSKIDSNDAMSSNESTSHRKNSKRKNCDLNNKSFVLNKTNKLISHKRKNDERNSQNLEKTQRHDLQWNESEGLVIKPMTNEYIKNRRKEQSISKARKMFRTMKFVSEQHDVRKWTKQNPNSQINFVSEGSNGDLKNRSIQFVSEKAALL